MTRADERLPAGARQRRNVLILATSQALSQSVAVMVMTVGGLVGHALATDKGLATLPVAAMFVGNALATVPASLLMGRIGRRPGFILGAALGAVGAGVAALAIAWSDFALFCAGTLLIGAFIGFSQFYRFAAADAASESFKSRAISLVLAGGVVAAIAGPEIAKWTKDLFPPFAFLGSVLAGVLLGIVAMIVLLPLAIPRPAASAQAAPARPLGEIMVQPAFVVALLGAAIGFGVMVLAMTATPLAMVGHDHGVNDAAFVIQWHVLGMFLPSFFTGGLIARVGVLKVMMTGVALMAGHVVIALSGLELMHFLSALVLLGVGWNFLFVGGTTLLTETYRPSEKAKVQAANDFIVLGVTMLASLSAGSVLASAGWVGVNLVALPFLAVAALAIGWLHVRQRMHRAAAQ